MSSFVLKSGILVDLNTTDISDAGDMIDCSTGLDFVVGYKVNTGLVIEEGLKKAIGLLKRKTDKPLIYDHQKLGSDFLEPDDGNFFEIVKNSDVDAIIIFPLSGKKVLESLVSKCKKVKLTPVVSGDLPYYGYFLDEGGYISYEVQERIYLDAASLGVSHFMMSCNRIDRIKIYCHQLGSIIGQLKIFLTAIDSEKCSNLPETCSQITQNKAYAAFSQKYTDKHNYLQNLKMFHSNFISKLGLDK
jgi:hypothetical protein